MGKEPCKQHAFKTALSTMPTGWTPVLYDLDSDKGQDILFAVKKDAELTAKDLFIADMNGHLLEKLMEIKGDNFVSSIAMLTSTNFLVSSWISWNGQSTKSSAQA
ncbi:hypothetical protein KCU64_g7426, partial [Aureobasidium melanogenum]